MEENFTNLDKIERFFEEELSAEELKSFEKDLEDEKFREDAIFYQVLAEVVREEGASAENTLLQDVDISNIDTDLRATIVAQNERLMRQKDSTLESTAKVRRMIPMRRVLSLAASVLILITAGTFWYANTSYSSSSIASQAYLNADVPGTMSGGEIEDEIFQAALQSYWVDKDLDKAKQQFSSITNASSKYIEAQYFLAHIHLQQEEFGEAASKFQEVSSASNLPNYINQDKLEWDLLMARLGAGEDINADLDRLIADNGSPLNQQAREMKQKLNSIWRKLSF